MPLLEHGWRQFNFFDFELLSDPEQLKSYNLKLDVSFWTSGKNFVLLGTADGTVVQLYDQPFSCRLWRVFEQRLYGFQLSGDLLVGVGEDETGQFATPLLKLWNCGENWDQDFPLCKLSTRINLTKKTSATNSPIVAISINALHNVIVIGFSDSSVFYCTGDFDRRKVGAPKFKALRDGADALGSGKLSGLVVVDVRLPKIEQTVIFVITTKALVAYVFGKDGVLRTVTYDDCKGCSSNSWYFCAEKQQLIVAGTEMVNFYDVSDCFESGNAIERGRCQALARGAKKFQVLATGNYLALLIAEPIDGPSTSRTDNNALVCIYDLEFRYSALRRVVSASNLLFVFRGVFFMLERDSGVISRLVERSTTKRLELLMERNDVFDVAIGLARRDGSKDLFNIYKLYGDYLYERGDYENSICQYIEAIGHIDSTYVIQKFSSGALMTQLCAFLEAMRQRKMAIPQHSDLLLGVYVRMRDEMKISRFIDESTQFPHFDLSAAVKHLCRMKFFRLAARLACLHKRVDLFLDIIVSDMNDCTLALNYLAALPTAAAVDALTDRATRAVVDAIAASVGDAFFELVIRLASEENEEGRQRLTKLLLRQPQCATAMMGKESLRHFTSCSYRFSNIVLEHRLRELSCKEKVTDEDEEAILPLVNLRNSKKALRLGQFYGCQRLITHVLEHENETDELVRYLLREGNIRDVVKYGGDSALGNMWIDLIICTMVNNNLDVKYLLQMLQDSPSLQFIHPLMVLESLARNGTIKFGDVKEHIRSWFKAKCEWLQESQRSVHENEKKLEEINNRSQDLENCVQIFQMNKCASCERTLATPSLYFYCKHAYHTRCFEDYNHEGNCPVCERAEQRSKNYDTNLRTVSHFQFRKELESALDPMATIARFIEQNAFSGAS